MNLSGHSISAPAQRTYCSLNGFMTQLFVISTDYWVLVIAICTFLMLADFDQLSQRIQRFRLILYIAPWFFASLWAGIGLGVAGYGNIGACGLYLSLYSDSFSNLSPGCWFTSDPVRLYVNFIPRWLIVAIILGLYLRLYFIIQRVHKQFAIVESETRSSLHMSSQQNSSTRNTVSVSMATSASQSSETKVSGSGASDDGVVDTYVEPPERSDEMAANAARLRKVRTGSIVDSQREMLTLGRRSPTR